MKLAIEALQERAARERLLADNARGGEVRRMFGNDAARLAEVDAEAARCDRIADQCIIAMRVLQAYPDTYADLAAAANVQLDVHPAELPLDEEPTTGERPGATDEEAKRRRRGLNVFRGGRS
jgi:hypothetical protein